MAKMYADGFTIREIAGHLRVSEATVIKGLEHLGVPRRPRGGRRPGNAPRPTLAAPKASVFSFKCRECGRGRPTRGICDECTHPLRAARLAVGLTQGELGWRSGYSQTRITEVEQRRGAPPSLAFADAVSDVLGSTRAAIFGPTHPCGCGCGGETLGQHLPGHGATVRFRNELDELATYAQSHDLMTTAQVAEMAGVSTTTILDLLNGGHLPGRRRRTAGKEQWLVRREQVENIPNILEQRRAMRSLGLARRNLLRFRRGGYEFMRTGDLAKCACGCGKTFYRAQNRLLGRPYLFYSRTCVMRFRWRRGLISDEMKAVIESPRTRGSVRSRWVRAWNGAIVGARGGRPKKLEDTEIRLLVPHVRRFTNPTSSQSEEAIRAFCLAIGASSAERQVDPSDVLAMALTLKQRQRNQKLGREEVARRVQAAVRNIHSSPDFKFSKNQVAKVILVAESTSRNP